MPTLKSVCWRLESRIAYRLNRRLYCQNISWISFVNAFSTAVRDVWVLLDSELTSSHHIDQVCRSCYYQLRQLRVIARSLTFNAFVFSRLDYCSSIFAGLTGVWMEKLRRVHRAAAGLIGGFKKFDHISQYMRDVLHWQYIPHIFPHIPQRISCRIASLV